MTLREQQKKLTEKLNETRKAIQKSIRELLENNSIGKGMEKQIQTLQDNIEKAIKLTLLGLNVATRDQIDFLNQRIEHLNDRLETMTKQAGDASKPKKKKAAKKSKKAAS